MSRVGGECFDRGEVLGGDELYRQQVVELFVAQPGAAHFASDPLGDPHPQLVGDHRGQHEARHVVFVVFAAEGLGEV